MYVDKVCGGYTRDGSQYVKRAPFLILFQLKQDTISKTCAPENTYAVVRSVAMRQLGHWMMGLARIEGKSVSLSGAYGGDGLPITLDFMPKDAKPLPRELYDAWNKGEGWNSAGSEAGLMRDWVRGGMNA